MSTYVKVDVTPDTPAWEAERRLSVGASEVAAVMGLSKWATALSVYKSKLGVDRPFDELLSFIGHESEVIIARWVERFSGLDVTLEPAFMARSVQWPFLHASFDRVSGQPFTTWQFKTAHQYTGHQWDEGIPTDIRVQVQAEMAVAGTPRAAVVVWIGGREFRLFWEPRDERFIQEQLIPTVRDFWDANVRAQVAPEPSTVAEINDVFPSESREVELSDEAFAVLEQYAVLSKDITDTTAQREALKVALAAYVESADTLTYQGQKVGTWRTQTGRVSFQRDLLEADHPEIVAKYTMQGAPFKVLRPTLKQKEIVK